jgi:hypothetical protein
MYSGTEPGHIKIAADQSFQESIKAAVGEFKKPWLVDHTIFIQSPLWVKQEVRGDECDETVLEVFPPWIEYYKERKWLNQPWKIIVIGMESKYRDLPYYASLYRENNLWDQVEKLLEAQVIDYSRVPGDYIGKDQISVFFHGHGKENIRGILGKIIDYVRNSVRMFREGEAAKDEIKEKMLGPAGQHLAQLQSRLRKYRSLLEYLPWEEEVIHLNQAIKGIEIFLKDPFGARISPDEIETRISPVFDSLSRLENIHKISEFQ